MIRPTCANCKQELVCEKNEVAVIHFINNDRKQGIDAVRWGDTWKCKKCGCRVIIGMGNQKLGDTFSDEYKEKILKRDFVEVKW